jgi:hypothetical protein
MIAIVRYQPIPKLNLTAKAIMMNIGRDGVNENWGSNILKNYTTRQQDFDNKILQGVKNDILLLDFTASYMLKHNLFLEAKHTQRNSTSVDPARNNNSAITSFSVRFNIAQRLYEF